MTALKMLSFINRLAEIEPFEVIRRVGGVGVTSDRRALLDQDC